MVRYCYSQEIGGKLQIKIKPASTELLQNQQKMHAMRFAFHLNLHRGQKTEKNSRKRLWETRGQRKSRVVVHTISMHFGDPSCGFFSKVQINLSRIGHKSQSGVDRPTHRTGQVCTSPLSCHSSSSHAGAAQKKCESPRFANQHISPSASGVMIYCAWRGPNYPTKYCSHAASE